jgi:hypothetical protein
MVSVSFLQPCQNGDGEFSCLEAVVRMIAAVDI